MSVYLKDMEMPRGCASCKISRRNGKKMICPFIWKCEWDIHDPMSADHRLDTCPLVPVPPHGDLIERKAVCLTDFEIAMCDGDYKEGMKMLLEKTESAPTIIPADKEGEG